MYRAPNLFFIVHRHGGAPIAEFLSQLSRGFETVKMFQNRQVIHTNGELTQRTEGKSTNTTVRIMRSVNDTNFTAAYIYADLDQRAESRGKSRSSTQRTKHVCVETVREHSSITRRL